MRHHTLLLCAAVLTLLPLGCEGCANTLQRPDGWSEATHGKDTSPNYALLFDTSRVHEIKITIAASDFQSMQEDLASLVGGTTPARPSTPPPQVLEACAGAANGDACSFVIEGQPMLGVCQTAPDGQLACTPQEGAPDEPPAMDLVEDDPIYVPVRIEHEGHVWTHVGMRYKGNSSLSTSFQQGIGKLPFRLHFDKYEDAYPEIDDQRFYGFKKLTFSSNWADDSQIRECFVKEVFRDRGVPAPRCAFFRVVVDTGEGATYWGLYSAVEDPSDGAMLADQLGGRGGNLYKPDGPGATFIQFVQESFVKKTNESAADWSDVQRAIDALHAEGLDAAGWRAGLEAVFDAELFLRWLAVNTVIVNWDAYGNGAHNYYLYGNPADGGRLWWVPWDHNLAMMSGAPGGGAGGPGPAPTESQTAVEEIFHTQVGAEWPLISLLLADPVYADTYRQLVQEAMQGLGEPEAAAARMREMHALVHDDVVGPDGELATHTTVSSEEAFEDSIDGPSGLASFYEGREARVREALDEAQ